MWLYRVLLLGALLFIAIATLTPGRAGPESGLRPSFTCLACGPEGGADVTLNIVLFLPLGIALALLGKSPLRAMLIGALISLCVECAQRAGFPPGRVANITDLLTNTSGTLIGATVTWYRHHLISPTPKLARALAVAGIVKITAFLALIAWSLGRDPQPDVPRPVEQSGLPHTPTYGWYQGRVSRVTMDGRTFSHSGDGPVLLFGFPQRETSGEIVLTGRDDRRTLVPMLYVHGLSLVTPELMVGQRGDDAEMRMRLRGWRLRLPGPRLVLRDAFADTGRDISQVLRFDASPREWRLTSSSAPAMVASLPVSLSLGWTLFQTVVQVGDITGTIVTVTWMFVLWLPIGYWCMLAGRGGGSGARNEWRWHFLTCGVLAFVATLALVPLKMDISPTLPWEWLVSAGGFATGVLFARLRHTSRQ
jgi:hypothetical protein